jgi:ABC-type nitrate/sulfonate/bicarbonate transport system ATPase subunit
MNLTISDLTFSYTSEKVVLANVSISVASGSTVAFVGPSGCGKTTLLQIIAGIIGAESGARLSGRLSWDGADSTLNLRRHGRIGYMFQTPILLPHLNVVENVVFPLDASGRDREANRAKALALLGKLGLGQVANYLPDQLSVGMRARVALARMFATEPSLLLLDEPFTSLDVSWRITLYNQWRSAAQATRPTTALVTHDIQEAFLLAERVVILNTTGRVSQVIKCEQPKPQTFDLDAIRDYFRHISDIVEETQYAISRDVVASTLEQAA